MATEPEPSMKVFCVGMRVGSQSMKYALSWMGYKTYGYGVTAQYYSHLVDWARHVMGTRKIDLRRFFRRWDASVGQPAMWFVDDMLDAFPDVKVVLNMRDPDEWFASYQSYIKVFGAMAKVLSLFPRFRIVLAPLRAFSFEGLFAGKNDDKEYCLARLEEIYQRVQERIPEDRILVYSMGDGWEPLCEFLGEPLPDRPFPHKNVNNAYIKQRMSMAFGRDFFWVGLAIASICLFGWPWAAALIAAEAMLLVFLYRNRYF